jgi:hypothetical protein
VREAAQKQLERTERFARRDFRLRDRAFPKAPAEGCAISQPPVTIRFQFRKFRNLPPDDRPMGRAKKGKLVRWESTLSTACAMKRAWL